MKVSHFLPLSSGLLLALAFPKPDLGWLAWVALVPWFRTLPGSTPKRAALDGWLAGTAFFLVLLYWIYPTCRAGGVAAPLAALATAGLAAILALTWALFGGAAALVAARGGGPALLAALWVAAELVRERVLGFPWEPLGNSQWRNPALLQLTAWTGVHGLSFLLAWMNAGLASALATRTVLRGLDRLAPPLLAVLLAGAGGVLLVRSPEPPAALRVAVLQGSIPQYAKWDAAYAASIRETYEALALRAAASTPDLVVWPESALPDWFDRPGMRDWALGVVRRTGVHHLIGTALHAEGGAALNAAVLLAPGGEQVAAYSKRHLVPFGEYVPLQGLLGRWIGVLNELGGFAPGAGADALVHPRAALGVSVCYEAVFPSEVREAASRGASVLVNLTNDGWYLDTAAPYQHLSHSALRAAENRLPLVRAANNGVSALFDAKGRLRAELGLDGRGVLNLEVAPGPGGTFFARFGAVFAWACAAASAAAVALALRTAVRT